MGQAPFWSRQDGAGLGFDDDQPSPATSPNLESLVVESSRAPNGLVDRWLQSLPGEDDPYDINEPPPLARHDFLDPMRPYHPPEYRGYRQAELPSPQNTPTRYRYQVTPPRPRHQLPTYRHPSPPPPRFIGRSATAPPLFPASATTPRQSYRRAHLYPPEQHDQITRRSTTWGCFGPARATDNYYDIHDSPRAEYLDPTVYDPRDLVPRRDSYEWHPNCPRPLTGINWSESLARRIRDHNGRGSESGDGHLGVSGVSRPPTPVPEFLQYGPHGM